MMRTQAQEQVFEWTQSERLKLQTVIFPPPAPTPQPPTCTRDAADVFGDAREAGASRTPPFSSRSLISRSLSLPAYAERADAERSVIYGAGVGAWNGARVYESSSNSVSSGHGGHGGGGGDGGSGDGGRDRVRQGTGVIDMAREGVEGQGHGGGGRHVSRSRDLKAQIKALLS